MMMVPLNRQARVAGGKSRMEKQNNWERKFVAMLGGSRRPITKDRPMSDVKKAEMLMTEGKRFPWSIYVAVGMNGAVVRFDPDLRKSEVITKFQNAGAIAGFVGVLMFNHAFRTYTRRILIDPRAQEKLDSMSNAFLRILEERMAEERRMRGEDAANAVAYAEVYMDSEEKHFSVYYSFGRKDDLPEPASVKAGTVYLVDAKQSRGHYQIPKGSASSWVIRFKLSDERFAPVMKQASELFAQKLREIQAAEIQMERV